LDISTPGSPQWLNHQSIDQILDLVAPSPREVHVVLKWLHEHGVYETNIQNFRDSLKVLGTVHIVERLLHTELYHFTRIEDGRDIIRQWGKSHMPNDVRSKVDVFTGVDDFLPAKKKLKTRPIESPDDGGVSAGYVIPLTIRNAYKIPLSVITNPNSSVGLIEFMDDNSFNAADLAYFQSQCDVDATKVTKIIGPYNPTTPDAESTLDVQYAAAIADNTTIWFWTVTGWLLDFSQAFFNAAQVPNVASMSWGWTENEQCSVTNCNGLTNRDYVSRVNTEWMKIGTRGVSLFAASGDQGAPGDGNYACSDYTTPLTPIFPGDSPYITSVGATMLVTNETTKSADKALPPICQTYTCAMTTAEGVCTYPGALITTGGGFSIYTTTPSWQQKAVTAYLNSGVALPPAQYFNAKDRGFPDISGLGHNYIIRLAQQWVVVDGTSCSSPIWAAMTGLINDARMNMGKKPIGFLAPSLYALYAQNPAAFNTIQSGNNKCTESCCAQYGYLSATGWDPVCGLGSPNYPAMAKYLTGLP